MLDSIKESVVWALILAEKQGKIEIKVQSTWPFDRSNDLSYFWIGC
jgi:hypothetical protein